MEIPAFDGVAQAYDEEFSHGLTGQQQRLRVQAYLQEILSPASSILELNCGTGEDACFLAGSGHRVLATDLSPEMVKITASKAVGLQVRALTAGFLQIKKAVKGEQFDLIFSNFGGLNCLSPEDLCQFAADMSELLLPGGHLISVIMPRGTLWERLYYWAKLQPANASRRLAKLPLAVPLGHGQFQETWYYSPEEFAEGLYPNFRLVHARPIGFFLPPSYLEPLMKRFPLLARVLVNWEKSFAGAYEPNWGDHCLLHFQKESDLQAAN